MAFKIFKEITLTRHIKIFLGVFFMTQEQDSNEISFDEFKVNLVSL